MGRSRSAIRNWTEYLIARAAVGAIRFLPRAAAEACGRAAAGLLDRLVPRLRRTALRNLQLAFPQMPDSGKPTLVDGVFGSVGRVLVAFAKFPDIRRANVGQWIRYEGLENLQNAHARGRGVLFATGHLGNWELSAYAHALLSRPMNVLVRPLDNPLLETFVERRRALSGNTIIAKKDFLRPVLKALAGNEAVGILVDHNALASEGDFVDFFGVPACSNTGFARLAAHSGAAVVPGFAFWSPEEKLYILQFFPEIPITGDALRDTAQVQLSVERAVLQHPEQWLWIHRRWKTRPPGEPALY